MNVVPAGNTRYPNLKELIKFHSYHIDSFASSANVTPELLRAVLSDNEELTKSEMVGICRLTCVPYTLLTLDRLIYIDRNRYRHRNMIEELHKKLYEMWDYQKAGSKRADRYMKGREQRELVNLWMSFNNGWPVAYCRYLGIKKEIDTELCFCRREREEEQRTPPQGFARNSLHIRRETTAKMNDVVKVDFGERTAQERRSCNYSEERKAALPDMLNNKTTIISGR